MSKQVSWAALKDRQSRLKTSFDWVEEPEYYYVTLEGDGFFSLLDRSDTNSDTTDFEANVKPNPQAIADSNGVKFARGKVTKSGWTYQEHAVEMTTAKLNSVYNKDKAGNDLGFTTITLYDDQDAVTTTEAEAVKTVVTWEPNHDIDIIGSMFHQSSAPASDIRMFVTAVPDYPAPTGSIPFVEGGPNLKHMGTGAIMHVDGRTAKPLYYNNPVPGTNKFEIMFKHEAGVQHTVQLMAEFFKP